MLSSVSIPASTMLTTHLEDEMRDGSHEASSNNYQGTQDGQPRVDANQEKCLLRYDAQYHYLEGSSALAYHHGCDNSKEFQDTCCDV